MATYRLLDPQIYPPHLLNSRGQCCGRKPLIYKRTLHRFCTRCDRAYSLDGDGQIPNWAWELLPEGFRSTKKRLVEQ